MFVINCNIQYSKCPVYRYLTTCHTFWKKDVCAFFRVEGAVWNYIQVHWFVLIFKDSLRGWRVPYRMRVHCVWSTVPVPHVCVLYLRRVSLALSRRFHFPSFITPLFHWRAHYDPRESKVPSVGVKLSSTLNTMATVVSTGDWCRRKSLLKVLQVALSSSNYGAIPFYFIIIVTYSWNLFFFSYLSYIIFIYYIIILFSCIICLSFVCLM